MNESDRYAFIEMYEKINTVRKQYANIEFSGEMVPTIVSIGKYNIGSILDEIDNLSESNKERFTSEITYFSNALEDLVNSKSREDFDYILKTVDSLYNELAELANIEKNQDLEDHNNNDKVEIYNKSLENYKKHTKEYLQNKKKYEKGEISFEEYQDFYKNLNNEYIELLEFYKSIENNESLELPKKPIYSSKKPEDLGVDDLVSKIAQYQKHYDVHESLYHEFNDLQDSYRKLSDVEKIERYAEYEKKALEVISSQAYTQEEYDKLKTFYEAVEKAFDETNKDDYAASPEGLKTFQEEINAYNKSIKKYTEEYIILEELASKLEENEGLRAEYEEQLAKVSRSEAKLNVEKARLSAKKINILNVNTYKRTEMNIHLIEAHLKLKNVTEEERLELEEKLKNLKNALKEMDIIKSTVKIKTIKKVSKIGAGRSQEKPKDPDKIEISGVHTPHKKTSSPFDDVAEPDKIDGYDKKPEEIIDIGKFIHFIGGGEGFSQKDGRKYTASHVKIFQPLHSEKEKLDHRNGGIGQEAIKYYIFDPILRGVRGIFAGTGRFFTKMWGLTLKKTKRDVIDEMQERAMALTDDEVKILLNVFHTETSREIRIPYVIRDALIRRIEIYCDKMIPYYQNYQEYLISEIKAIEAELEKAKDVNVIADLISKKSRLIEEHWKIREEFDNLQKEEEAFRSSQNAAMSHRNYYGGVFEKVPDYNPELWEHIENLEWQKLNGTSAEREAAIVELDNLKRKNTITDKKWYNFGKGVSVGAFDVRDKVQKLNYDKNTFYTDLVTILIITAQCLGTIATIRSAISQAKSRAELEKVINDANAEIEKFNSKIKQTNSQINAANSFRNQVVNDTPGLNEAIKSEMIEQTGLADNLYGSSIAARYGLDINKGMIRPLGNAHDVTSDVMEHINNRISEISSSGLSPIEQTNALMAEVGNVRETLAASAGYAQADFIKLQTTFPDLDLSATSQGIAEIIKNAGNSTPAMMAGKWAETASKVEVIPELTAINGIGYVPLPSINNAGLIVGATMGSAAAPIAASIVNRGKKNQIHLPDGITKEELVEYFREKNVPEDKIEEFIARSFPEEEPELNEDSEKMTR